MENAVDFEIIRNDNTHDKVVFKKVMLGGYSHKEVDEYVDLHMSEREELIKEYDDKIAELKTMVSMTVRERDKCIEENIGLKKDFEKLKAQILELQEQNNVLDKQIAQLEKTNESLKENTVYIPPVEPLKHEERKENQDNRMVELEVENELLQKNNEKLNDKFEALTQKITELSSQLMLESATSKTEILKLQGELYRKTISYKYVTNRILESLKIIESDVEDSDLTK